MILIGFIVAGAYVMLDPSIGAGIAAGVLTLAYLMRD